MRGGNRQRQTAIPGTKVPRAPRDATPAEAEAWRDLKQAVEAVGTYQDSDLVFFTLTVRAVVEARAPGALPPTARARLLQAAGAMLNAFGLSPLSRERVKPAKDPLSPAERVLALVDGGGR